MFNLVHTVSSPNNVSQRKGFNILDDFVCRNVFGPVLGSSPAQTQSVLPSMQHGFGGEQNYSYYCYGHSYEMLNSFHVHSFQFFPCVTCSCCWGSSSGPFHKPLCSLSRRPRDGQQSIPEQRQTTSSRSVSKTLSFI